MRKYFPDSRGLADTLYNFTNTYRQEDGKMAQEKLLFLLLRRWTDSWVAMAIEPVLGQLNQYRRIGLAEIRRQSDDILKHWFDEAESSTIEII
jgi:hypothetical protein